jgi:Na+/melibiose symporter-like transporter
VFPPDVHAAPPSRDGSAVRLAAGNLLAGAFASGLWVFPFSMMADVVDEDELRSGMRREGTCFGRLNFGE